LPFWTEHRELREGQVVAENKFSYADFHKFDTSSKISLMKNSPTPNETRRLPPWICLQPAIEQSAVLSPRVRRLRRFDGNSAADEGRFEALTISGQLQGDRAGRRRSSVILMGSSLGGYLAALYASRHPDQVERLVLLAPAFSSPGAGRSAIRRKTGNEKAPSPFFITATVRNGGWDTSLRKTQLNMRTNRSSPSRP